MTDDSRDDSQKDRDAPTVRDLKGPGVPADTVPDVVGLYVPPRPPPEVSRHRTLDLMPVRIAAEADPRHARTERRLVAPERPERGQVPVWLVAGIFIVFGLAVWALARTPSRATQSAPSLAPAPPSPPLASVAAARADLPAAQAPSGAPESIAKDPPASPVAPKSSRPREAAKKKNQPWVE